jgi:hypothetical protein
MLTKTRRGAADISRAPSGFSLENQFAAELENPRVKGTVCDSKIRAGYGRAQETIELSVIERVEAVNAELESSPLRKCERLVYRSVEVSAAGADDGIFAGVTKTEIRAT